MNCFEKWQVLNGAIANILLFGTLFVAAIIGFKQMKIVRQQTRINQKLLDLEYELSLDLEYDQQPSTRRRRAPVEIRTSNLLIRSQRSAV